MTDPTAREALTAESEALLDDLIGTIEASIVAESWNDDQARRNLADRLRAIEAVAAARALAAQPGSARVEALREALQQTTTALDVWVDHREVEPGCCVAHRLITSNRALLAESGS